MRYVYPSKLFDLPLDNVNVPELLTVVEQSLARAAPTPPTPPADPRLPSRACPNCATGVGIITAVELKAQVFRLKCSRCGTTWRAPIPRTSHWCDEQPPDNNLQDYSDWFHDDYGACLPPDDPA